MKAGSIASNPSKLKIMNLLVKKGLSKEKIVKSTRIPENLVNGILDELMKDGFVAEKDGVYSATEEGKKALKSLKV
ncbi:winged helix-turn-helix domain-containing protein [Archaeoglobus neptunius]|uniref:winged helix-turn-helix domain-containing protein n=1 Tax=Archaeoglobus neptunius TaxID=2798580 RepID=UPI001927BF10|nr:winged helix-turn-helix domain-containing protein [Archaeoglobus neptunius]